MELLALTVAWIFAAAGLLVFIALPHRLERRRSRALNALSWAVAARGGAGERPDLAELCRLTGEKLNLTGRQLSDLEAAVRLCKLGLAATPLSHLGASRRAEHAAVGAEMVRRMPSFSHLSEIVSRHETPYRDSTNIPIEARIICAVEGYLEDGLDALRAEEGGCFCPVVVAAIESVLTSNRGRRAGRNP